jgi:hypothetical protein
MASIVTPIPKQRLNVTEKEKEVEKYIVCVFRETSKS